MSANDLLSVLHGRLARELLTRLESGEATAADLNVIRQFLKDNGITADDPAGSDLDKLARRRPMPDLNEDFEAEDHA